MRIILLGPRGQLGSGITEGNKAASGPVELVFSIARAARRFRPGNFDLATSVASLSALTFDALINRTGCYKTDDVERNAAARSSPCLDDLGGPG